MMKFWSFLDRLVRLAEGKERLGRDEAMEGMDVSSMQLTIFTVCVCGVCLVIDTHVQHHVVVVTPPKLSLSGFGTAIFCRLWRDYLAGVTMQAGR